jgi:anti-anti-sigma factor
LPVIIDRATEPATIRLEGEVDIADAAELQKVLVDALQSKTETRLWLEGASRLDVTAVQLLLAAEREARGSCIPLKLQGAVPAQVRETFRAFGFERFPFAGEPEDGREAR